MTPRHRSFGPESFEKHAIVTLHFAYASLGRIVPSSSLRRPHSLMDNPPGKPAMPTTENLSGLLSEFIILLLGALLMLIALTRTIVVPSRPVVPILLGVVFIFWAARAWLRPAPNTGRLESGVRAGSLAIVGILLIATPLFSLGRANVPFAIAGGVLVVRGIVGAVLSLRAT
jgi:hypothetical protein